MIKTRQQHDISQTIKGPVGQLEAQIGAPTDTERNAWGIVCHPHSLYGGNMNNKVVTTLAKTFQGLGLSTVRFNFRGVGLSEGLFDQGNGELEDLLAVIDWIQRLRATPEIWLAGFSFGAFVATKAATQFPVSRLVTVAPPVNHFPMQDLTPLSTRWVLVQGERDDVVPANEVFAWAESRNPQPLILRFPEAGHFFHGLLNHLRVRLEEVLRAPS
jgi:uncharacterized protein